MNVLWIMADQLRRDYLGCFGASHIETPNLDWLASRGMRFDRAYVQCPLCGPSRMSFYTGRYVRSHGSTLNGAPLRVGEITLGDHLREVGVTSTLVGKTHMVPDRAGMQRLGIDPQGPIGALVSECGFEVFVRDDGENPTPNPGRRSDDYDAYLRSHGMDGDNPWEEWANTAIAPDGSLRSGWALENAAFPARVPRAHSETAWLTTRGMEFMAAQGDAPWLCHLSYIKPHWPYLAPSPYNAMYGPGDLPPVNRSVAERENAHPLLALWREMRVSRNFSRDDIRDLVGPVYMGLIKELDDQMGRLFAFLRDSGRMEDTMIVFCSDHGDQMGDHWMGEKEMFYDASARIPLIVYDPRPEADATRGTTSDLLVEGIDLAPTFLDVFGAASRPHVLEGRSLQPILHGQNVDWRGFCVSELDFATRPPRRAAGIDQAEARMTMVFDGRWKYIHVETMRPLLFDLQTDPDELHDLGDDPRFEAERARLSALHHAWARRHHNRITRDAATVEQITDRGAPPGILIGYVTREEVEADGQHFPGHVTR